MRALIIAAVRAAVSGTRAVPHARLVASRRAVTAAASTSSASAPTPGDVRTATMRWVDERVIGLNLCPFASAPRQNDGLKLVVCEHTTHDLFFETFTNEARALVMTYAEADTAYDDYDEDDDEEAAVGEVESGTKLSKSKRADPPPRIERWQAPGLSQATTTLITVNAVPDLDDFLLFLAVVERCERILESDSQLDGKIQLATFHPDYQFAGEEVGDPGSYTNRSPYPTVHLLRTVDVSRAVDQHPDTESIPNANIKKLRELGRKTLYDFVRTAREFRSS